MKDLSEIFLMGFYPADQFSEFIEESKKKYRIRISYLEESTSFGTAGGLVSFKEELLRYIAFENPAF